MKEAVIVASVRSAMGKAPSGSLKYTRPEELGAQVMRGLLESVPAARDEVFDDVIVGCAMPEGEQGSNMARLVAAKAGVDYRSAAQTVNRFCASGLQTIATASYSIMAGQSRAILAGGIESMSTIPMGGARYVPDPELMNEHSAYYMAMGHTAECVAREFGVSREEQDAFAVSSHKKAQNAQEKGYFTSQIIPVTAAALDGSSFVFDKDEGVRATTSLEGLGRLRPAFTSGGSVTAGNSSQTSDGAAFSLVMEKEAALQAGMQPMARFLSYAVAGVRPEVMGIGPLEAIPKALKFAGLSLQDIDLIELNEAFASQAVVCIRDLKMDKEKVNVNGGAIAMGHPLGCTGAALTAKLLHELRRRGGKYGIVSMCIGGGQGAAAVFEMI